MIFNWVLQYIFIVTPLCVHLIHDVPVINHGGTVNHKRNAWLLCGIIVVLGLQLQFWARPHVQFWQYWIYAACIHFSVLNYAMNRLRRPPKPFAYVGHSFYDFIYKVLGERITIALHIFAIFAGFYIYHIYVPWT